MVVKISYKQIQIKYSDMVLWIKLHVKLHVKLLTNTNFPNLDIDCISRTKSESKIFNLDDDQNTFTYILNYVNIGYLNNRDKYIEGG